MVYKISSEARSLEEAFFRKQDEKLIEELRRKEADQSRKKTLAEISGIADERVLDQLVEHDIHPETLAAFSLVPIIEVAWADGKIDTAEKDSVLHAVEHTGIAKDSVAFQIVQQWLQRRPEPTLLLLWKDYTRALMADLDEDARDQMARTVLQHARTVAEAAGGFLGMKRTSAAEEATLDSLAEAFKPAP